MRRTPLKYLILLFLLPLTFTCAKTNNTNKFKISHENHINSKVTSDEDRVKRAVKNDDDKTFWHSRGKKIATDDMIHDKSEDSKTGMEIHYFSNTDLPARASQIKRDSLSVEDYGEYIENNNDKPKSICKDCPATISPIERNVKSYMEPYLPFWGNRGRRDSTEVVDEYSYDPFWGARGRRQDKEPFWGNRGRRDDEPFWGNRGRRNDEIFLGNRGRREDAEQFWGSRGRRHDSDPFWANRGKKEDADPFWGNRGRRKGLEPLWPSNDRQKELLSKSTLNTLSDVESDIENLSRLKRNNGMMALKSFWENKGKDVKVEYLFNPLLRGNRPVITTLAKTRFRTREPATVHDSRIYAEQPHYILAERVSRSSVDEDPYVISRGKKYNADYNIYKESRDRRGAIDEIVKSVRNDPYYIARGKKNKNDANSATTDRTVMKAKELVCSAVDLVIEKTKRDRVKRDINDNDRDGRTILKKLAAQLQNDPYYVSRGKKSNDSDVTKDLLIFFKDLAERCN